MNLTGLRSACAIILWVSSHWASAATPCDGMDQRLTSERKSALETEIARQLNVQSVGILQSFGSEPWSIFYVDSHAADEAFLFYDHDPELSRYVILWSGAARSNEESSIGNVTLDEPILIS
jgi:hypothetical protein